MGYSLGILDTSNIIEYGETMPTNIHHTLLQFERISSPDSIYLQTTGGNGFLWSYFAYTSRFIQKMGPEEFLNELKSFSKYVPYVTNPNEPLITQPWIVLDNKSLSEPLPLSP